MNQKVHEINDENIPNLDMANSIRNQVTDFRRFELGFIVAHEIPQLKSRYTEEMRQKSQGLQKVLNKYQKNLYNEEEANTVQDVIKHWEDYYTLHQHIFD